MTTPTVKIGGTTVTGISDVEYSRSKDGNIGKAKVSVSNTPANRALANPGASLEIYKNGNLRWFGDVTGKPSVSSRRNLLLEIQAETGEARLEHAKIRRPVIERTPGRMVESVVNNKSDPTLRQTTLDDGSDPSVWETNANFVDVINSTSAPATQGGNSLYLDMPDGTDKDVTYMEKTDLPTEGTAGRRLERIRFRAIINNAGGVFTPSLVFVDDDGIQYRWSIPGNSSGGEFENYTFDVTEATIKNPEDNTVPHDPGTLRFEFDIRSPPLGDNRAVALDFVQNQTFRLIDRSVDITPDITVPDSQKQTRRPSKSVLRFIQEVADEDAATTYVTPDGRLIYKTRPSTPVGVTIDETTDNDIVEFEVNRDFGVRNVVTVQGQDDLQATFSDTSSIQFYNNNAPKEKPISDPSLRTREQLESRALAFLRDNAWTDGAIVAKVLPERFRDVEVGDIMEINYPSEDINGQFRLSQKTRVSTGFLSLSFTGTVSL